MVALKDISVATLNQESSALHCKGEAKYLYHPHYKEAWYHCKLIVQHLVFPQCTEEMRSLQVDTLFDTTTELQSLKFAAFSSIHF